MCWLMEAYQWTHMYMQEKAGTEGVYEGFLEKIQL